MSETFLIKEEKSAKYIFLYLLYCTTSLITDYKYTYVTINWLLGNASSDSSPIKLNHNWLGMAPHFYEVSRSHTTTHHGR
jgi:hypothetical protein